MGRPMMHAPVVPLLVLMFLTSYLVSSPVQAAVTATELQSAEAVGAYASINCPGACAVRCSLNSRPNLCHRACGTCCTRCQCVPPGTSGNYETCPCYATMTTHGGRRKCP